MKFNSLIPELSVTSIEKSKEFYKNIRFKIIYERIEDKFCFLELEGNQIMIHEENDTWNVGEMSYPFGRGINISMNVSDVKKMYQYVINNKIKIFKELEVHHYRVDDKVYDDTEFLIQDPDGYLLRFNN